MFLVQRWLGFYFDLDRRNASIHHPQLLGRAAREIDGSTLHPRAAVIDLDFNLFTVFKIRDFNNSSQRQISRTSRQLFLIKNLTIGCPFPLKSRSVPGCLPYFLMLVAGRFLRFFG